MNYSYGARNVRETSRSVTYSYTPIRHPVSKSGRCPSCGKRRTRSTTFEMTMSPFNKDPETGQPRTDRQIRDALRVKAEAWVPDFTCTTTCLPEVDS